jgi:hypothetical protein
MVPVTLFCVTLFPFVVNSLNPLDTSVQEDTRLFC